MMIKIKTQHNQQNGFTLIELLVVIAIIALLSSVILVYTVGARERARQSKVKSDIVSILKAVELVYDNYGYYPSDATGGALCPRDVIVDSARNITFEQYANVCNDPYGHPYEWSNNCANGQIRKADGSSSACKPFSDSSPGPVGVLSGGADGIAEGCADDDVCNGYRGFSVSGWDGQNNVTATQPSPTPVSGSCTTVLNSCSAFTSSSQCSGRTGCSWTASTCTVSVSISCSSLFFGFLCNSVPGCSWSGGSCRGSQSCSGFSSQSSCVSHIPWCTWNTAQCSGTPVSCSTFNQSTCATQSGCSWQ